MQSQLANLPLAGFVICWRRMLLQELVDVKVIFNRLNSIERLSWFRKSGDTRSGVSPCKFDGEGHPESASGRVSGCELSGDSVRAGD